MNQIVTFFAQSPWAIIALFAFVISLTVGFFSWNRIKFWAMDFKYTFPFIGRINSLSKNPTQSPKAGWTNEEQALCGDYAQHAKIISEKDFKDTLEYLRLSGDIGREPMPGWAWLFIALLVLAEGYGFSYLLGTWITRDGDANLYRLLAAFLAFVICGLMLWLTHNSGRELHRTGLLKSCRSKFQSNERAGNPNAKAYFTEPMGIGAHADRDLPMNVQTVNRVADHASDEGGYWWTGTAIVAMIFIAALSFWMRHENLQRELIKEADAMEQQSGNPFATGAAPKAKKTEIESTQHQQEIIATQKSEGGAAFAMLAGIFVLTQIVSIGLGMKYGFAGKQGKRAYSNTHGYVTYSSYYNSPIFRLSQARLQTLQQRMERRAYDRKGLWKTYSDYCREEADHEASNRDMSTSDQYAQGPSADALAARVNALTSREDKLAFLSTIQDGELREQVRTALARQKATAYQKEEAQFGDVI